MRVKGLTIDDLNRVVAEMQVGDNPRFAIKRVTERKREGSIDFRVRGPYRHANGTLTQWEHERTVMMCNHVLALIGDALFAAGATEVAVQQRDSSFRWYDKPFEHTDMDRIGSCKCVIIKMDDGTWTPAPMGTDVYEGCRIRVNEDYRMFKAGEIHEVSNWDGGEGRVYLKTKFGSGRWVTVDGETFQIVLAPGEKLPDLPKVGDYFRATKHRHAGSDLREGAFGKITKVRGRRVYYQDMRGREPGYYTLVDGIEIIGPKLPDGVEEEKPPPPKWNVGDEVVYSDYPKLPMKVAAVEPRNGGWDGYVYKLEYPWGGDTRVRERYVSPLPDDAWKPEVGKYYRLTTRDYRYEGEQFNKGCVIMIKTIQPGTTWSDCVSPAPWEHDPDWDGDDGKQIQVHFSYLEPALDYVPPPRPVDKPLVAGVKARLRKGTAKVKRGEWFTMIERQWGEPAMWMVRHDGVLRIVPEADITRRECPPPKPMPDTYDIGTRLRIIVDRPDAAPYKVGDMVTVRAVHDRDHERGNHQYRVRHVDGGSSYYVRHEQVEPEFPPVKPKPTMAMAMGRVYAKLSDTGEMVCVSDTMWMPYCNNLYDELEAMREAGELINVDSLVIDTISDNRWPDARRYTLWMQPTISMRARVTPTKDMADEAAKGKLIGSGCSRRAYLGADGWLYKKANDPWQNEAELKVARALHKIDLPDWFAVPEIEPVEGDDKHYVIAADYIPGERPHGGDRCKCIGLGLPKCYADLLRDINAHCKGKVYFSDTHAGNLMIHEGKLWIIDLGHCEVQDPALLAA